MPSNRLASSFPAGIEQPNFESTPFILGAWLSGQNSTTKATVQGLSAEKKGRLEDLLAEMHLQQQYADWAMENLKKETDAGRASFYRKLLSDVKIDHDTVKADSEELLKGGKNA